MNNELEFFGTNQQAALNSMCNKIISNYNNLGYSLPCYEAIAQERKAYYGKYTQSLIALFDKLGCLIFDRGDPLSVPIFLKRVATGKTRDIGQPNGEKNSTATKEETFLGHGHFRCYGKVYTLTTDELKAVKLYINSGIPDFATTEFKFKNLLISARLIKSGVQFPNDKNSGLHNKFNVSVNNTETGDKTSFDFYGSTNDYNNAGTEIKGEELLNAFECFISDSLAAEQDFDSFCAEFGYDNDSRTAERIYKECEKSLAKARLIIDGDLYEFANDLREVTGN